MHVYDSITDLEQIAKGQVLTIGNFDGVHLGHQEIVKTAKKAADRLATTVVVMTFEPHPVVVLHPEKAPEVLTPLALKKHLLAECGLDCLVVLALG